MDNTQSPLRPVQSDTMAAQTPLPTSAPSANTPGPKKRRNTGSMPSLPKPKKQKLPRNLDSITARNQLPNVPSSGGVNKAGQRMVKGPYKKREKKDKDGKKINAGATGNNAPGTPGSGVGSGAGGKKAKSGTGKSTNASTAFSATGDPSSSRSDPMASRSGSTVPHTSKDEDKDDAEGRKVGGADANRTNENGEPGAEGKEDDEDEQEEEPEYTEYEWNQEANSRGRSKDELKYVSGRVPTSCIQMNILMLTYHFSPN